MALRFKRDALKALIKLGTKNFCRRSQCSRQQADSYKKGKYDPSISTLEEISKGFELDADYFFEKV